MSFFLSIFRVIKFAIQNIFRNFWLSLVTFSIFVLTLVTINVVVFINVIADAALESVEEKIEILVYFQPETPEDIVSAAQAYVQDLAQVREARVITAEDALAIFQERYAGDDTILSSLEEIGTNPFGDALVISSESAEDFALILEAVETPEFSPHIKEKDYEDYELVIERIETLSERVRIAGVGLIAFFIVMTALIVFNTIRVAIYIHRDEIGIMKLVGAGNWFVRAPFIIEAFIYSVFSVGAVALGVYLSLDTFDIWVHKFFGDVAIDFTGYFNTYAIELFGAQFIGFFLLSTATTYLAMRRYLKT